jgi:hypothetical protein
VGKDLLAALPKGGELAVFRVAHGETYFWTMADNMRGQNSPPREILTFFFALLHCASLPLLPYGSQRGMKEYNGCKKDH